jgi:hypothetical protein
MRLVELWADEPPRPPLCLDPRVISLEPIKRARQADARRAAYDDGTIIGFFLGVLAMALVWAILSGLLMRLAVVLVHAAVSLLSGNGGH